MSDVIRKRSLSLLKPPPPILEVTYQESDNPLISNGKDKKSFLVATGKDTWVFPWKPVGLYTGIDVRIPDDTVGLITGCPWSLEDKIHVHPQVLFDDSPIFLMVSKIGILPRKIKKGTYIGNLTIIGSNECILVEHQKDSLD